MIISRKRLSPEAILINRITAMAVTGECL